MKMVGKRNKNLLLIVGKNTNSLVIEEFISSYIEWKNKWNLEL